MTWVTEQYTILYYDILCAKMVSQVMGLKKMALVHIWVAILAAGGPYWVLISQKVGFLIQSLGVLISFGGSAFCGVD